MSEQEVRRELLIDAAPDRVWAALTEPQMLEQWLASDVELEPRVGGRIELRDEDGRARAGVVEHVDERSELVFRWCDGDGIESRVRLQLDAVAAGSRLVVVESRTAAPLEPAATMIASVEWGMRLAEIAGLASIVPVGRS